MRLAGAARQQVVPSGLPGLSLRLGPSWAATGGRGQRRCPKAKDRLLRPHLSPWAPFRGAESRVQQPWQRPHGHLPKVVR